MEIVRKMTSRQKRVLGLIQALGQYGLYVTTNQAMQYGIPKRSFALIVHKFVKLNLITIADRELAKQMGRRYRLKPKLTDYGEVVLNYIKMQENE